MIYEFECSEHGVFEVKQPILVEHKANCPVCSVECQRKYTTLQWMWNGEAYRPDGSKRDDKDYARLKG